MRVRKLWENLKIKKLGDFEKKFWKIFYKALINIAKEVDFADKFW